jgi:hypothetical protein
MTYFRIVAERQNGRQTSLQKIIWRVIDATLLQ